METTQFNQYQESFRIFNARRGVNDLTIKYYEEYMKRFFMYTGASIDDFYDKKTLLKKYERLFVRDIKNETRKKHLKALRVFSDFLEENEIISENFARKIRPPRVSKQLPKPIEDSEIEDIYRAIRLRYSGFLEERNVMIIKTFLST